MFNTFILYIYYLMWCVLDNAMTYRTCMSCALLMLGNNYTLGTRFVVFRLHGGVFSRWTLMAGTWCCCWSSRIIRFNTSYNIDYKWSLWRHHGRLNWLGSLRAIMAVLEFTRKLRRLVCNNNVSKYNKNKSLFFTTSNRQ